MDSKEYMVEGIPYTLIRKRIKNVHLRVRENAARDDVEVVVSAPMRTPIAFIQEFVSDHRDWIEKQRQHVLKELDKNPMKGDGLSSEFLFKGEKYRLQVAEGKRNTLVLAGDVARTEKAADTTGIWEVTDTTGIWEATDTTGTEETTDKIAYLTVKNPQDIAACHKFIAGWYRNQLKLLLDERLPYWEQKMQLFSTGYQIRDMKSRWGSCNVRTRKLHFNLQLIYKPVDFIDYVIVHELAHIREASHSPRFWTIVEMYIPNWKQIRKKI